MTDYLWPPDIAPAMQTWGVVDPAGTFTSPLSGATRTVSRPGSRLRTVITMPPVKNTSQAAERARLIGVLSSLRGRSNRIWVPDFSTTQRGSFPATELLTNNDFSNGTTGWSAGGAATISATDRSLRVSRNGHSLSGGNASSATLSMAAYVPYVSRAFPPDGPRGTANAGPAIYDSAANTTSSFGSGMRSAVLVTHASGAGTLQLVDYPEGSMTMVVAGTYQDFTWASVSRCALIDARPNLLTYSDQFDNAAWTKTNCTIAANDTTAPDGTATADALVEDSTNAGHYLTQGATVTSSAVAVAFSVCVKAGTRSWAQVQVTDLSAHAITQYINLATGALGSFSVIGSNITDIRSYSTNLGDDWYRIDIVVKKGGSQTAIYGLVGAASADNGAAYSGTPAAKAIYVWRGGMALSEVPFTPAQTVATATTGTAETGRSLYVKGLPASTQGLLRVGDPVQIGTQMNFVASPLDSDAAGKGLLVCGLPWRASPADNDPIIVNTPMAKMILTSEDIAWDTGPGQFSSFQLEFVEDVA